MVDFDLDPALLAERLHGEVERDFVVDFNGAGNRAGAACESVVDGQTAVTTLAADVSPIEALVTANADPTSKFDRKYRSAIFTHTPEQAAAAEASKARLQASGKLKGDIATEIVPAAAFYRAEEYHQRYLEKRGQASCPSTSP